jgi:hypothetical protein
MTRLYGRAPRGQRLLAKAPFGHWKTTTPACAGAGSLSLHYGEAASAHRWCSTAR